MKKTKKPDKVLKIVEKLLYLIEKIENNKV